LLKLKHLEAQIMTDNEIVKHLGKTIAIVVKNKVKISGGKFFTPPRNPLQIALHHYNIERETRVHKSDARNTVKITEFHKFLYMTIGTATVYFMSKKLVTFAKKILLTGDGIIIMSTFHKVVFSKNSDAIEIKQGPYKEELIN